MAICLLWPNHLLTGIKFEQLNALLVQRTSYEIMKSVCRKNRAFVTCVQEFWNNSDALAVIFVLGPMNWFYPKPKTLFHTSYLSSFVEDDWKGTPINICVLHISEIRPALSPV